MSANKSQQHLSKVTSLKNLCQRTAFEKFMDSETKHSDFAILDNRLQRLLYSSCRSEINRLRVIEQQSLALDRRIPKVDKDIWLCTDRVPDGEDGRNPHEKIRIAQDKWSYADPDDINTVTQRLAALNGADEQHVEWSSMQDLCFDEKKAKFRIMNIFKAALKDDMFPSGFSDRISSPLLLYRATVIFGMPPPSETDGYKSCWELVLNHSSGKGTLELGEHKGCPSARFEGSKTAGDDALDLINLLTYVRMPHTYDGTVAGTIA